MVLEFLRFESFCSGCLLAYLHIQRVGVDFAAKLLPLSTVPSFPIAAVTMITNRAFKITQFYYLVVLNVRSLKWVNRAVLFLEAQEENPSLNFSGF